MFFIQWYDSNLRSWRPKLLAVLSIFILATGHGSTRSYPKDLLFPASVRQHPYFLLMFRTNDLSQHSSKHKACSTSGIRSLTLGLALQGMPRSAVVKGLEMGC